MLRVRCWDRDVDLVRDKMKGQASKVNWRLYWSTPGNAFPYCYGLLSKWACGPPSKVHGIQLWHVLVLCLFVHPGKGIPACAICTFVFLRNAISGGMKMYRKECKKGCGPYCMAFGYKSWWS